MNLKLGKRLLTAAFGLVLTTTMAWAQSTTFITIGSGSTSGLYYPTAVGMAKILTEADVGLRANARSTGASVFNANAIGEGSLQMGLMQNNIAYYAYNGTGVRAFENNKIENLRGLIGLYPEAIHILAREDAGIDSVDDLAGKRVYVGDVGSGTEQDAMNIMGVYGVTVDDLQGAVRGSSGDAVGLLRDDQIAAMFYTVGLGSAAIVEAAQTAPITVIPISDDQLTQLQEEYGFYTPFTIPAGTYPGVDEDVQTVTLTAMLGAAAELSEDDVYTFMNTVFNEHLDTFYRDVQNPNLDKFFTVEKGIEGMPIPLHPGAVKFYEEQGVEVPDDLIPSE
ncbi:TRAP ABC transporter [Litchfieldella qijiaojingensis]|uniref:TRAP ABC transporter n=1 Tax=Litchfieldella qijiaojingensis TaxID=980347 RepID=A0ABQ2Z2B7_9GAMM|nr:TAXI family TRAP transporter solute-binding subunit [Halomonas qijiaojingensis]GGY01122.1 TRAP ABC transporter [Halomonas qijiaojingensis]